MILLLLLAQTVGAASGGCVVSVLGGQGLDLSALEHPGDAIVVGTGVLGPAGLSLTVQGVIQGPLKPSEVVPLEWHSTLEGTCPGETSGRLHGLWVLERGPNGWVVRPYSSPPLALRSLAMALPEPVLGPRRDAEGQPPIDKLIDEVRAATLSDDTNVAGDAYEELETITRIAHKGTLPYHPVDLPDTHASTCALRKLLGGWDLVVVDRLEKSLASDPGAKDPALAGLWEVRDPRALPALVRIWDSGRGGSQLRGAVARAVWNIHTEEAIPLLVRFLDESDWETRYMGVTGLAMFAARCPPGDSHGCPQPHGDVDILAANQHHPAVNTFQRDPESYVAYWKEWASNRSAGVR
jgi:hypothetical protein